MCDSFRLVIAFTEKLRGVETSNCEESHVRVATQKMWTSGIVMDQTYMICTDF